MSYLNIKALTLTFSALFFSALFVVTDFCFLELSYCISDYFHSAAVVNISGGFSTADHFGSTDSEEMPAIQQNYDEVMDKVTKDFSEVAPSLQQNADFR